MKKILSLLLIICMISSFMAIHTSSVFAQTHACFTYEVLEKEKIVKITDCDNTVSGTIIVPETIDGYPVGIIEAHAFAYCENIENIILPNTLTAIGAWAFQNCDSLTNLTIPQNVTWIGQGIFNSCIRLKSVVIPDGITYISDDMFANCKKITEFEINDNIVSIGKCAFEGTGLTAITIPKSVNFIGQGAFKKSKLKGIGGLENIYYEGTDDEWNNIVIEDTSSNFKSANVICKNIAVENDKSAQTSLKQEDVTKEIAKNDIESNNEISDNLKTDIKIGDYIQMGKYYNEPILWRCVDIDENGALILSDKIVCIKAFDAKGNNINGSHGRGREAGRTRKTNGSNYWADSNIRCWLNSAANAGEVEWICGNPPTAENLANAWNVYTNEAGFLTNFTKTELNIIKNVTQKSLLDCYEYSDDINDNYHKKSSEINEVIQNYDAAFSENTTDTIFLLDVEQIYNVYDNSDILGKDYYIGEPTEQCVENSDFQASNLEAGQKYSSLLRSPNAEPHNNGSGYYLSYVSSHIRYVDSKGEIQYGGVPYYGNCGIRPAFYLNDEVCFNLGEGTKKNPYIADNKSDFINDETHTFKNNIYKVFDNQLSWNEANDYCEKLGGHLVTLTSDAETEFVTNLIQSYSKHAYWIGGYFNEISNDWAWITDEEWKYENWSEGNPDRCNHNGELESYIGIVKQTYGDWGRTGQWNDFCNTISGDNAVGFVCEWENINLSYFTDLPQNLEMDFYGKEKLISVDVPNAKFEIEDKKIAKLEKSIRVLNVGQKEQASSDFKIIPLSPGNTTITVSTSDGRKAECKLTVTGAKIVLNGEQLSFDQPPINTNGRLLVPIRKISESMGRSVYWNQEMQTALIDNETNALIVPLYSDTIYKADEHAFASWEQVSLDVPALMSNDRILVPIRAICENLDANVEWDSKYSTAYITFDDTVAKNLMSDSLFDSINLIYYLNNFSLTEFEKCSDDMNYFYDNRNHSIDAMTMGFSDPWAGVKDIASMISDSDNATNIIRQCLYDILAEISENQKSSSFEIVKAINDTVSTGIDIYSETGGLDVNLRVANKHLDTFDYYLRHEYKSKYKDTADSLINIGIFTAEELSYIFTEYTINLEYLDIFRESLADAGYSDETLENAFSQLEYEYTDKFVGVLVHLRDALAEDGFSKALSTVIGDGSFGLGNAVWNVWFNAIGVTKKGEALKTFYGIYCFDDAVNRALTSKAIVVKTSEQKEISKLKSLIQFVKAEKIAAYNAMKIIDNDKKSDLYIDECISKIQNWSYYIWER